MRIWYQISALDRKTYPKDAGLRFAGAYGLKVAVVVTLTPTDTSKVAWVKTDSGNENEIGLRNWQDRAALGIWFKESKRTFK